MERVTALPQGQQGQSRTVYSHSENLAFSLRLLVGGAHASMNICLRGALQIYSWYNSTSVNWN